MHEIPLLRPHTPMLDTISDPSDIRSLSITQLAQLCKELRLFLMYSVGQSGGHFGAGLGVVELTIALHRVFHTPEDDLVWDVGHQTYPHKILTGRREAMLRVRHSNGPAPFPVREESAFDVFGAGHSSTSISAALGLAIAKMQQGDSSKTVAIIGDGGLTAGMAFEALNHGGACKPNMLVILNDNAMSISHNVGALASGFRHFFSSHAYTAARSFVKKTLSPSSELFDFVKQFESHTKGLVIPPAALFEALHWQYFGPVDGHNLHELLDQLTAVRNTSGVSLLHVRTVKGKGFGQAEIDPVGYHALSKITPVTQTGNSLPTFSKIFGRWLCVMGATDEKLHAITPAMCEGSGLVEFATRFPQRYQDVGIAEQHSLTLAAGMACKGRKPVVAIYSTFLQRAYDQLIHDICLQNLDVTLAIDRAGLVGEDGPTHHGAFDLTYLRCVPNLLIGIPADEAELHAMLTTAYLHNGPAAVRYPRGSGIGKIPAQQLASLALQAEIVHQGEPNNPALLVFGTLLYQLLPEAKTRQCTLVNMRYLQPLDTKVIDSIAASHHHIAVIEDNSVIGGCGSAVAEYLIEQGWGGKLERFGIPKRFIPHGSRAEQLTWCGLTEQAIFAQLFP